MHVSVPARALFLYVVHQMTMFIGTTMGLVIIIPLLSEEFGVGLSTAAWVQLAYVLALVGGSFGLGKISMLLDRRHLITFGLLADVVVMTVIVFTGSIYVIIAMRFLSALVRLFPWLILQVVGIGGFPAEQRGKVVGFTMVTQGIGMLLAVPVIGLVTEEYGWRWLFAGSSVVFALMVPAVWLMLPKEPPRQSTSPLRVGDFDLPGSVLIMLGSTGIIVALQLFTRGQASPLLAVAGVMGLAVLAAFVWVELRTKTPILPFALFKIRGVFVGATQAGFLGLANGALLIAFPLLFVNGYGWTLVYASGIMLFFNVVRPVSGLLAGWMSDKYGSSRVIAVAMVLAVAGQVMAAFLGATPIVQMVVLSVTLAGLGQSFMQTANLRQLFTSIPRDHLAIAPTTNLVMVQFGTAVGQAFVAAMVDRSVASAATPAVANSDAVAVVSLAIIIVTVVFTIGMVGVELLPRLLPQISDGVEAARPSPAGAGEGR